MNIFMLLTLMIVLEFMRYGRNRIINKFLASETVSPHTAKQFKDVGVSDMFSAKILLISGIIKQVGDDQYYLDLSRKMQIETIRINILYAVVALAVLFLIGAVIYLLAR